MIDAQKRDLEADLAICEKATEGPWETDGNLLSWNNGEYAQEWVKLPNKTTWNQREANEVADNMLQCKANAQFIAAAREGWPKAIRRAMEAESRAAKLEQIVGEWVYDFKCGYCKEEWPCRAIEDNERCIAKSLCAALGGNGDE